MQLGEWECRSDPDITTRLYSYKLVVARCISWQRVMSKEKPIVGIQYKTQYTGIPCNVKLGVWICRSNADVAVKDCVAPGNLQFSSWICRSNADVAVSKNVAISRNVVGTEAQLREIRTKETCQEYL